MSEEGWARFGWQGLQAEVPSQWELVGIPKEHDPDQGYLRLDDANHPRLELKWRAHSQRQFDISKTLDEYLKGIRKAYSAQVGQIEVRRDQALIPDLAANEDFYADRELTFFSWKGALQAHGVIWRCSKCRRIVMSQVIASPGEPAFRQTAMRVLRSLRDHSDTSRNLWTAYGFEVEVPRRYRLDKLQLLNGYILFSFTDGSSRIAVERYGLADQALRGGSLEAWFRRAYAKSLRGTHFVLEPTTGLEPVQMTMDGRSARVLDRVDRWDIGASRGWDQLFRRSRTMARMWYDPDRNRIFVVRASGKPDPTPLVDGIVFSIPSQSAARA